MCDHTECEYGALVRGERASFANCGLNTEAELLLARAGKFEK